MKKAIWLSLLLCIFASLTLDGQIKQDLDFILTHNKVGKKETQKNTSIFKGETSEIKMFFLAFLHVYRKFISTQDKDSCIFTVTCSLHGVRAVKRFGVAQGLLIASDRLQRCHTPGKKYYPIDPISGQAIDFPLKYYRLKVAKEDSSKEK